MTPYEQQRDTADGLTAMSPNDALTWSTALAGAGHRVVRLPEHPELLEFTNYPWNKVIRTEVYRRQGLVFGTTRVHNDILGHWQSLILSREILLVDDPLCTHIVHSGAPNLTNRHGEVRLDLIEAFEELGSYLDGDPRLREEYGVPYWALLSMTSRWAYQRLAPDHQAAFRKRLVPLLKTMSLHEFARMRMTRRAAPLDFVTNVVLG